MQPNTITRQEYKGKIYDTTMSEKTHPGSQTGSGSETNLKVGSGYGSEKNHSGSTTLRHRQQFKIKALEIVRFQKKWFIRDMLKKTLGSIRLDTGT
jgi:hypothetical protein